MLRELHQELGIPSEYGEAGGPPRYEEALELVEVGLNLVGRMQRLTPAAAKQWQAMAEAMAALGIISGAAAGGVRRGRGALT